MWLCDSSGKLSCTGSSVSVEEKPTQSTKFNALWKGDGSLSINSRESAVYYELVVEQGQDVWFGLCPESQFGAGWKCHGFMYGGNLSDGGALMRSSFGPRTKTGSVIGMLASISTTQSAAKTLDIYFSVDGVGLGKAFQIEGIQHENDIGGALFPVVSFSSGPAKATICKKPLPGPVESMSRPVDDVRATVNGEWSISGSDIVSGENLPEVVFVVDTGKGMLHARVANSLNVRIAQEPPHAASGGVRTTLMMPPPHLQNLEQTVSGFLEEIKSIRLANPHTLEIQSGQGSNERTLVLSPHQAAAEPVKREEVNWLTNE